jgi:hypothetical protein
MVGTGRFELPTPRTPSECSTRLSHVPTRKDSTSATVTLRQRASLQRRGSLRNFTPAAAVAPGKPKCGKSQSSGKLSLAYTSAATNQADGGGKPPERLNSCKRGDCHRERKGVQESNSQNCESRS